jgi:non-specific serine/threonine protein kinase/serine/threonine-protein kinase
MRALSPERWQHIKKRAAAALDLDPAERDSYIARTCEGDAGLEAEVRSLLASADAAAPYFEEPPGRNVLSLYARGHRIGPYRIVRELASGGMGSVYLAERADGDFEQRVAIKVVRGGFGSRLLLDRFREERRILAALEHPNIARLLDGGTTETGLPYVAMEYVEGEVIDRFCDERRLPLRERLRIFRDVCAAAQYAHQHLVVHRDIKGGNILVTADGTPKLLDFGIAKLVDEDAMGSATVQTTLRIMTPENASPEQISGKPVSVATDIYALGVLLYRLLTNRSPYGAAPREGTDLIRAVCEEIPEPPSMHGAAGLSIPADVDRIVMKALRKEPERRYASAGALSEDVERFLDGRPVLAVPDSLGYRASKFVLRHRLGVAAAAALSAAVGAGVATTLWQARVADRERTKAQREFNAVRGIAQSMLGEVHDAVTKLPGSTPAREILLRRGTEYLDALSPEAAGDDALRREVAMGYLQLSHVQGNDGAANLGNRDAAIKSLDKAVALLEPLVREPRPAADDRVRLVTVLAALARFPPDARRDAALKEARALLASLSPGELSQPHAVVAREMVWERTAAIQVAAGDYRGADVSQQRYVEAAGESLRQWPSAEASYNLSLGYKYHGATLEMLGRRAEAIALYRAAAALDRQRIEKEPGRGSYRLDLSFAEASIGSALLSDGDAEGARAEYERAVADREAVVEQDPADDFARAALARGYDRLANVYRHFQNVPAVLDYTDRALRVYRGRMDAHPERDFTWQEYTNAILADVSEDAAWLATCPSAERGRVRAQALARLDLLESVQQRWTREKHAGVLAPPADAIQAQRAILQGRRE